MNDTIQVKNHSLAHYVEMDMYARRNLTNTKLECTKLRVLGEGNLAGIGVKREEPFSRIQILMMLICLQTVE